MANVMKFKPNKTNGAENDGELLDLNEGILIPTTGHPIADLKMIVNRLHEEEIPVEELGAMLCNVIDMLEGSEPDYI